MFPVSNYCLLFIILYKADRDSNEAVKQTGLIQSIAAEDNRLIKAQII